MAVSDRLDKVLAGKYRIESLIGGGGMGIVYAARHLRTEHRVAIKFLKDDVASEDEVRRRFLTEAKAAANLRHPNIVRVFDFDEDPTYGPYMILELLEGQTLSQSVRELGRLGVAQTLAILVPIMHALDHAHGRGVIHRDVKPANIFLHREGDGRITPKLLDFGIVRMLDGKSGFRTRPSAPPGTPMYMAPEQAHGLTALSGATDVWSTAVTVYECLTGSAPFKSDQPAFVFAAVMKGEYEPLASRVPDLPHVAALQRELNAALESDPSKRTPDMPALVRALCTAAEFDPSTILRELGAWSSGAPSTSVAPAAWRDDDHSLKIALLVLAALAALAVAGFGMLNARTPDKPRDVARRAAPAPAPDASVAPEPEPEAPAPTPPPPPAKPKPRGDKLDLGEILVEPK